MQARNKQVIGNEVVKVPFIYRIQPPRCLDGDVDKDYAPLDSFVIYMCVGGEVELETEGGKEHMSDGDVVLIPAEINDVCISGKARLLEIYVG